jgi:hypothetical protein
MVSSLWDARWPENSPHDDFGQRCRDFVASFRPIVIEPEQDPCRYPVGHTRTGARAIVQPFNHLPPGTAVAASTLNKGSIGTSAP